jgi:hypothetical protein
MAAFVSTDVFVFMLVFVFMDVFDSMGGSLPGADEQAMSALP